MSDSVFKIPKELRDKKQWTYSYSSTGKDRKRPTHFQYEPDGALDYKTVKKLAVGGKLAGFYATYEDPYVLMDIDHIEDPHSPWAELPVELAVFLQGLKTYSEISPSGKGIRLILKLPEATDKQQLTGNYYHIKAAIHSEIKEMQINVGSPWQTITGNATQFAYNRVDVTTLEELGKIFELKFVGYEPTSKEPDKTGDKLDPLTEVVGKLMTLPHDENPRIRRAYTATFGGAYQHYDYWLKVMMAMHDYAERANKMIECMDAVVEWSSLDTESFNGEDDVIKHWRSLTDKEQKIGYKSLHKLYYTNTLRWPKPKKKSKEEDALGTPIKPQLGAYANFQMMVDYFGITLHREEGNPNHVYLEGDEDVVDKWFMRYEVRELYGRFFGPLSKENLISAFYEMCQDIGFDSITHNQIHQFVTTLLSKTKNIVNVVKYFFDQPFESLPLHYQENAKYYDVSTLDYAFECLDIDYLTKDRVSERALYRDYYRYWLMGLSRNLWFMDGTHMNNCVLLLTGPEQIRKTSHFRYLLPSFLRDRVAFTIHGFTTVGDMRDLTKISASSLMIVWDEIEKHLNSDSESNFKKLIDNNPQTMIDKYAVLAKKVQPVSIYGGTSNHRDFKLGQEGSRRIFHIPVKWVDTDKMATINWHRIINDLREEISEGLKMGIPPWLLTDDQLTQQFGLQKHISAKNSIDLLLEEIFDSEAVITPGSQIIKGAKTLQGRSKKLMTTREVTDVISQYSGMLPGNIKRPALIRSLERLCGNYTATRRAQREFDNPRCIVIKGEATQGSKRKWVMPDMRQEAKSNMFKEFRE